jgi:hypothetical protein
MRSHTVSTALRLSAPRQAIATRGRLVHPGTEPYRPLQPMNRLLLHPAGWIDGYF